MVIKVTRQCIAKAGKSSSNCPIALALKEAGLKRVLVGSFFYWQGDENSKDLPIKAQKFIRAYDDGLKVHPFQFRLNAA